MKLKALNEKKEIIVILTLSLLVRLILSIKRFPITWDSAVYVGMGKYIFSFGGHGLWEPIRPIVWPFLIGFFWRFNFDVMVMGKIIQIILSLASIYLLFKISKHIFSRNIALLTSLLFSFSLVFLEIEFNLQTGVLATFFVLLSVYLFLKDKIFLTGLFAGIAFLTKFYYGIFLLFFLIFLVKKKSIKAYWNMLLGFGIPLLPYLILNLVLYKNPFFPFISANYVINNVVACNFLYPEPGYYFFLRILIDNPLNILCVIGFIFLFRKLNLNKLFIFCCLILPFIYLVTLSCKTPRYLLLFLPFLLPVTALGIDWVMNKLRKQYRLIFLILIILFTVAYPFYTIFKAGVPEENFDYYNYLAEEEPDKIILTNNPKLTLYTDNKLELLYYPLYNTSKADFYAEDVVENKRDYIFIDTCYGDLICNPNDLGCDNATQNLMSVLKSNYQTTYYSNYTVCEYFIFSYK